MSKPVTVQTTDQVFEDATLGGVPCKAIAWVEVTRLKIIDGRQEPRTVDGVRTWHGRAFVDLENVPEQWQYNSAVRYEGKVRDGEDVRNVAADVYIHYRVHRPAWDDINGFDRPPLHRLQVRFTGAGNLRYYTTSTE